MKRKVQVFSDGQMVFMSAGFSLSFSSEDPESPAPTLVEEIDISNMSEEDYSAGKVDSSLFEVTEINGEKTIQRKV